MRSKDIKVFIVLVIGVALLVTGTIFARNKINSNDTIATEKVSDATTVTPTAEKTAETSPQPNTNIRETDIILFYGSTCPHCKKVDEYIEANKITTYIKFKNLEVYENRANAELMTKMQDKCSNIDDGDKGAVPFLYSSQTCLVGDQPIMDYLKLQAGI